jgi:hypothetical protein
VAVDSVTKFVEVRPLKGSKLKGVDLEEVADFLQTEILHRYLTQIAFMKSSLTGMASLEPSF